jgi:predicted DNA-binding protein with PD1-like motif
MEFRKDQQGIWIRLEKGEEVVQTLQDFARREELGSGWLQGLGAIEEIILGFYELHSKTYRKVEFKQEAELISLQGNLSIRENEPFFHFHCSCSDNEFKMFGGHLFSAKVAVTVEGFFSPGSNPIHRAHHSEIGLDLWQLGEEG